jgi:hypothetical protein
MSYASFDVISQFGPSNHTYLSKFGFKRNQTRQKEFSFVNFENPLYFFEVKITKDKVVLGAGWIFGSLEL